MQTFELQFLLSFRDFVYFSYLLKTDISGKNLYFDKLGRYWGEHFKTEVLYHRQTKH